MEKVITLFRGENCYFAINQDAEVVSSLCNVKITSAKETKYSVFSNGELDRILPILVRHGNRVYVVDPKIDE